MILPSAKAKRIKSHLPSFLKELEMQGVRTVRPRFRASSDFEKRATDLGISHLIQSETTSFPGSIYLTIDLSSEKSGGMVPEKGDALAEWIGDWLSRPEQQHNVVKLRSADVDERHVFVIVPSFADAPFQVVDLLSREEAPLPTVPPALPDAITHLWCVSTAASGWLELVAGAEATMSCNGSVLGGACRVPLKHRPGPPAGNSHEVGFTSTAHEPKMAECVPEQVRMDA